eukprot:469194_1
MSTLSLKSRDNYPDRITATLSAHTSPKVSVVVGEPENGALIHQLEEHLAKTFVISTVISGIDASPRFNGQLNDLIYGTTFMIDTFIYRTFPPVEDDSFDTDEADPFEDDEYHLKMKSIYHANSHIQVKIMKLIHWKSMHLKTEYSFGNEEDISRNFAHIHNDQSNIETPNDQYNNITKIGYKNNHIIFRTEYNVPKILDTSTTFK